MAKIILEDIEFYAHHGYYAEEKETGGRFILNIELEAELDKACISDELEDTFNYQQAYDIAKEEMLISSSLIEHVAARISDRLLSASALVKSVKIKISKMNPPLGGNVKAVCVELTRVKRE